MTRAVLITDAAVEAAGKLLQLHEYRVDIPTWICHCPCGWREEKPYDTDGYDQHVARLVLEAVAPLIAAKALQDASAYFCGNQMIREGDVKKWLLARADRIERGELYHERIN